MIPNAPAPLSPAFVATELPNPIGLTFGRTFLIESPDASELTVYVGPAGTVRDISDYRPDGAPGTVIGPAVIPEPFAAFVRGFARAITSARPVEVADAVRAGNAEHERENPDCGPAGDAIVSVATSGDGIARIETRDGVRYTVRARDTGGVLPRIGYPVSAYPATPDVPTCVSCDGSRGVPTGGATVCDSCRAALADPTRADGLGDGAPRDCERCGCDAHDGRTCPCGCDGDDASADPYEPDAVTRRVLQALADALESGDFVTPIEQTLDDDTTPESDLDAIPEIVAREIRGIVAGLRARAAQ